LKFYFTWTWSWVLFKSAIRTKTVICDSIAWAKTVRKKLILIIAFFAIFGSKFTFFTFGWALSEKDGELEVKNIKCSLEINKSSSKENFRINITPLCLSLENKSLLEVKRKVWDSIKGYHLSYLVFIIIIIQ
jgi:hypothetical protein